MRRVRGIIKTFVVFIISLTVFLLLLFLVINLPFSHRYVTQKVNKIFTNSNLPVHINSVNNVFPWSVYVQGVLISGKAGDTIVYADKVRSGLKPFALLRKKLTLRGVHLDKARINFIRNPGDEQLNIAEAFSVGMEADTVKQNDKKKPFEISVDDAEITRLKFIMTDSVGGIFISQDVASIKIVTRKMSLTEKTIIAESLEIERATGSVTLNQKNPSPASDSGSAWNIGLGELMAENINFVYDDPVNRQRLDLLAGEIGIKARETDIGKKIFDIDEISVSETTLVIRTAPRPKDQKKENTSGSITFPLHIKGDLINLQDVAFQMLNYSDMAVYNPLSGFSVMGLGMKLSDLEIDETTMKAGLENLKFDLGNGFSVKDLTATLDSRSGSTRLDLEMVTSNSRLNFEGVADKYISEIISNPAGMKKASLIVRKADLSIADIFYFKPDLKLIPGIKSIADLPVAINADIKLEGSVITLPFFSVSQVNRAEIDIKGNVANIFESRNIICDLEFGFNEISRSWLSEILKELRPGISLPDYKVLSLNGTLSDSLRSPRFTIRLLSDLGRIDADGSYNFDKDKFSIKTSAEKLLVGKILNNNMFGPFNGSGEVDGSGILNKKLRAEATFKVDSFSVKNYVYTLAAIDCRIDSGKVDVKLKVDDPSLKVNIVAGLNYPGAELSGSMKGNFEANLYKLHFLKDTIIIGGMVSADLRKGKNDIMAELSLGEIKITTPGTNLTIHKISGSLRSDSLITNIAAEADFFSSSAYIQKPVGSLGQFLRDYRNYMSSLIDIHQMDSIKQVMDLPLMNCKATLSYNEGLRMIIPDSALRFNTLSFSFKTDPDNHTIIYLLGGKGIKYNFAEIGNLTASLSDSVAILDLNLRADSCTIASQPVKRIQIKSHFYDWKSLTSFSLIDKESRVKYNVEINTTVDSNNLVLMIPSGQLTLNGVVWQTDSPEFLKVNLKTMDTEPMLRLHTDDSFISFLRNEKEEWQNYVLDLKNVALASIVRSDILPGKPDLSVSGTTTYSKSKNHDKKITTDLSFSGVRWSDLSYRKITLTSTFNSDSAANYNFDAKAFLDSSEIKIKGIKVDKRNSKFNTEFKLIPVNTIQPFVSKYLSNLRGTISGEFEFTKRDEINNFTGNLYIDNGSLKIKTLNSSFRLPEDSIRFTGKKMVFRNFKVLDSLNNALLVQGFVEFSDKNKVSADIEITSSNLQILNRKEDKNSTFYGDVFIDSKLSIKGLVTSPVLKGKVILARGTDIYFRQAEDLNLSESGSVVTFTDSRSQSATSQQTVTGSSIYSKSSVESVVEIDPSTRINIEISKKMFNIDMSIQGGGELNYNMLVNSQVNLSGKYEISNGGANLKMVGWPNKAFKLTKGGYIRWDGKLDDPELNLEAVNRVKSSYVNPVDNKERYVDFDVTLKISNRLSALDVSFTISTADQYLMSIINTMSPEEQMRQAITILLFEYIDLPGISTSSSYVSEQVNQMVAAQLNSLTKTTIKGIDISFGLDTYTQGASAGAQTTKTSLSYEVKKNLLNDRAKVEFSGIVTDASNQSNTSNTSLNNFSFEYRIDSAGTKFLKVYNEHSYEDVFEGDVVKTGIGFTYRKSYPTLGDIWRKKGKIIQPNTSGK
jgi:translocation and assembly module TamB